MDTVIERPPRKEQPPEEATLVVGELDAHGTSRTNVRGKSVEIEHGIPGETVDVHIFGKRRRWARIMDIVSRAPDRVDAPCVHFHQGCGGCQWQMLGQSSQIERKKAKILTEFADAGLPVALKHLHTSDEPWRYRITVGLSLGRSVGFRRHGTQSIVGLDDCLISHPLIGELAAYLNQAVASESIPNFLGKLSLEVRVVEEDSQPALHTCITPSPDSPHSALEAVMPLAQILARNRIVTGVMFRHRQDAPQLLFGKPFGTVTLRSQPFAVSAATFFQTNMNLLPNLAVSLIEAANARTSDTIVDIYGGVGLLGLLLADKVERVIEIEIDPVGLEAARLSASMQKAENVEFLVGTAESLLVNIEQADTVIVDPPRSGLTPKVIEAIGRLKPRRILYVSCLPRSMARDCVSLAQFGYSISEVEAFDFYPQTYHVELFGCLEHR